MADGQMTWADQHRPLIDKIKAGGPKAAIEHHTKGMLAIEASLYAMIEHFDEDAGDDRGSDAAKNSDVARMLFHNAKTHHSMSDVAISDRLGADASAKSER